MALRAKLTAVFELVGENGFTGYIPALPEVPQVVGQGVMEAKKHLEHQLQLYFQTNFSEQLNYFLDIILIFPPKKINNNYPC
jgi:predicted RNase H-like HicB family nuclease